MDRPTPRVNSSKLGDYTGRTVRIIGKVVRLDQNQAILEASDNGQVTVTLSRETNVQQDYVEVIGRVEEDHSIHEYTSVSLGENIDMGLVEKVVELTHAHTDLFPNDA